MADLAHDAARGAEAQAILESSVFKESIERVQQSVFDAFAATDPKDLAGLQEQRLRLKCLADILRDLKSVMDTGKIARHEIEQEKTMTQRLGDKVRKLSRGVF